MSTNLLSQSNALVPVNEPEQTVISGVPETTNADSDERFSNLSGITAWLVNHDYRANVFEKRHSDAEDVYVCAFGLYKLALQDPTTLDGLRRHPVTSLRMRALSASKVSHLAMMIVTQAVSEYDRKQYSDHANILEYARKEGVAVADFRSWLATTSLRKAIKEMRGERKRIKEEHTEKSGALRQSKKIRHITLPYKANEFPFLDIALNRDPKVLSRAELEPIFSEALQRVENILREGFIRYADEAEAQPHD